MDSDYLYSTIRKNLQIHSSNFIQNNLKNGKFCARILNLCNSLISLECRYLETKHLKLLQARKRSSKKAKIGYYLSLSFLKV
jgi:hypothetical protein